MFEEELKNDIFTNSPIGATMQDGGKRERSVVERKLDPTNSYSYSILLFVII